MIDGQQVFTLTFTDESELVELWNDLWEGKDSYQRRKLNNLARRVTDKLDIIDEIM